MKYVYSCAGIKWVKICQLFICIFIFTCKNYNIKVPIWRYKPWYDKAIVLLLTNDNLLVCNSYIFVKFHYCKLLIQPEVTTKSDSLKVWQISYNNFWSSSNILKVSHYDIFTIRQLSALHSSSPVPCVVSTARKHLICINVDVWPDHGAAAQWNYSDVVKWAIFIGFVFLFYTETPLGNSTIIFKCQICILNYDIL